MASAGAKIGILFVVLIIFVLIGGGIYYAYTRSQSSASAGSGEKDSSNPPTSDTSSTPPTSPTPSPSASTAPSTPPPASTPAATASQAAAPIADVTKPLIRFGSKDSQLPDGSVISFRNKDSGKICSDDSTVGHVICNRDASGSWEKFSMKIIDAAANKIALKGGASNKWCSYDGNLVCNRDSASLWETLTVVPNGDSFLLRSEKSQKNCKARDGVITCEATFGNPDEQYTLATQ